MCHTSCVASRRQPLQQQLGAVGPQQQLGGGSIIHNVMHDATLIRYSLSIVGAHGPAWPVLDKDVILSWCATCRCVVMHHKLQMRSDAEVHSCMCKSDVAASRETADDLPLNDFCQHRLLPHHALCCADGRC